MRLPLCCLLLSAWPVLADGLRSVVLRDDKALDHRDEVVLSYRDAVSSVRDSVVTIWVRHWKPKNEWNADGFDVSPNETVEKGGNGSGIVLTADGLILTNYHVVYGAKELMIRPRSSANDVPAEIVGFDGATDVALLRAKSGTWKPATLTNSDGAAAGDVVLALGSPFGLEQTVTMGILSATGRSEISGLSSQLQDFLQTDAAINPGNSGGPLVDGKGRVLGMNTARYGGEGIGLAVPINLALKVADDLQRDGRVGRGYLGVRLADVNREAVENLKLGSAEKGAVVTHVEAGLPGDQAGLRPGDVITAVNGLAVSSRARFLMRMTTFGAGDRVKLTYSRDGAAKETEAALIAPPGVKPVVPALEYELVAGLRVALIDDKKRNELLLPAKFEALLVLHDFKSRDGKVSLAQGDFILKVNGRGFPRYTVQSDEEFMNGLRPTRPLVLLTVKRKSGEQVELGFVAQLTK
ncbi:MAG: trypsin-like peptidase domain-containing protein [Verrucomicrobiaceae bacterium]|nr:trypsin-like peptidase domain-containing protein [Verrucomicrobiaceae bacterium]